MLSIGALGKRTGTKAQTIRCYEQIGLMPEPGRTEGGQRRYGDAELDWLAFIRDSRQPYLVGVALVLDLPQVVKKCLEATVAVAIISIPG